MSDENKDRNAITAGGAVPVAMSSGPALVYHTGTGPMSMPAGYSEYMPAPLPATGNAPYNAPMPFPVMRPSITNVPLRPSPLFDSPGGDDKPKSSNDKEYYEAMPFHEHREPHMALPIKLAHTVSLIVAATITALVAAVLADGASVIKIKPASALPRITEYSLKKDGLDYRLDELLGSAYGVGLHHDSSGATWNEAYAGATLKEYVEELGLLQVIAAVPSVIATDGLKHPAHFLSCYSIQDAGLAAESFGIIAEVVAIFMMFYHLAALIGFNPLAKVDKFVKVGKAFSVLIWLVLSVGFLVVCCDALGVFFARHICDNPFIGSVKLAEHFDWQWGYPIANVGFFAALASFVAQLFFTPSNDRFNPTKKTGALALLTLVIGVVIGVVASVSVAAGVGAFQAPPPVDPMVNPCEGQKPYHAGPGDKYFANVDCMKDGIVAVLEQAGANVTRGYVGGLDAGEWRVPITKPYDQTDLCPVNVHWHLGAEHLSMGEYDERGTGPADADTHGERRGHRCHFFNAADPKFTTPYNWQYCKDMTVGETYEVHWPHSAAGQCGSEWQYQTPFYDGVFCNDGVINILTPLNTYKKIGVQAQTFTIVNDEAYFNGNLFNGMIVDEEFGAEMTMYTGSTTGTSRDNDVCSRFAPITWQVDRKCHMISASSFDAMCKKMKEQRDDMSDDLHAHGARETVADHLVAGNQIFDP